MRRWVQSPVVSSGLGLPIWRQPGFWREGAYAAMLLGLTAVFFFGVLAMFQPSSPDPKWKAIPAAREKVLKKRVG